MIFYEPIIFTLLERICNKNESFFNAFFTEADFRSFFHFFMASVRSRKPGLTVPGVFLIQKTRQIFVLLTFSPPQSVPGVGGDKEEDSGLTREEQQEQERLR